MKETSRGQDPANLRQCLIGVGHVLQHVHGEDRVELSLGRGQEVGLRHSGLDLRGRLVEELEGVTADVGANQLELRSLEVDGAKKAACAASHLQNSSAARQVQQHLIEPVAGDRPLPGVDRLGPPERRVVIEGPLATQGSAGSTVRRGRMISTDPSLASSS